MCVVPVNIYFLLVLCNAVSHSLGWCLEWRNSHKQISWMTVNSAVHLWQWPAQAALKEIARNPTSGSCGLSCLQGKLLLSAMWFVFDSRPKKIRKVCLPIHYFFSPANSCTQRVLCLPAPFGGARQGAVQVNHSPKAEPRASHGQTRGAAVAASLMAHRPRNLSHCRHIHCRCTLALCTHSPWARGVWGSCPSCFWTAQEKGQARHQQLVIFPRPLAEKLSCNLANLPRCTRGRLGPQQRVGQPGSTSLPQPSGRAVCLALKRKRTFAPSSGSEGASAGLKPIKASCEKWRREGRETLIIMTRKNAIKKNKEKGKTDPIWEANETQIQNRPLRSVSHKAAALGAAFTCGDAEPLGPSALQLN